MARSIAQIQQQIWTNVTSNVTLSGMLTSTSTMAVWWLWTWVVATAQWVQENLFDAHQTEVTSIIAAQKPHTLQWYATKAKAFQYGDPLPADSDVYNPIRPAGDVRYIVTYAAAIETVNFVRIKVATGTVGVLSALSPAQLSALTTYMGLIKDAGVRLEIDSNSGDLLQTVMNIYYDPLVLTSAGAHIDGTSATPVPDAINQFLDNMPFNGIFKFNDFVAALQAVEGVVVANVSTCQAQRVGAGTTNILADPELQYTPDAGYLILDTTFFAVNYLAYS